MNRRGAVLIEVLVALAILSLAGTSAISYLAALLEAEAAQIERMREMRRAERLLTATALLTESELGRRLGVRPAEDFLVWVDRPEPYLFRIGISPAARPSAELLATLVHRRGEGSDGS